MDRKKRKMKRLALSAALILAIAVPASSQASCVDWGLYAVRIAEMRNGGLTEDASQQMMWDDALSAAQEGASNATHFAGFDPNRAKAVIASVYRSHHDPSYYGVVTTDLCHTANWSK
jgi:hypothetical protein